MAISPQEMIAAIMQVLTYCISKQKRNPAISLCSTDVKQKRTLPNIESAPNESFLLILTALSDIFYTFAAAIISCGEMCRQRAKFLLPDIDGTDDACLRKMIVCERREILPELFDGYYITSCVSMDKKHTEESGKCPMAVDALNRSRIP